jgi:L-cystine uptake protein TcyP (sodium:dicarboxylate symporter family)
MWVVKTFVAYPLPSLLAQGNSSLTSTPFREDTPMKRAFTVVTFALAMVALNGARPATISAQASVDQAEAIANCFAAYCISCGEHHIFC